MAAYAAVGEGGGGTSRMMGVYSGKRDLRGWGRGRKVRRGGLSSLPAGGEGAADSLAQSDNV